MSYAVVLINGNFREKKEEYDKRKSAEKKIEKSYKKKNTKIILLPDSVDVGFEIFLNNGQKYATITRETDVFWYAQREGKDSEIMFLKSEFENKYINETFIILEIKEN